jgi:hypothetical protein
MYAVCAFEEKEEEEEVRKEKSGIHTAQEKRMGLWFWIKPSSSHSPARCYTSPTGWHRDIATARRDRGQDPSW